MDFNYKDILLQIPSILGIFLSLSLALLFFTIQNKNAAIIGSVHDAISELDFALEDQTKFEFKDKLFKSLSYEEKRRLPDFDNSRKLVKATREKDLNLSRQLLEALSLKGSPYKDFFADFQKQEEEKKVFIQCFKAYLWVGLMLMLSSILLIFFFTSADDKNVFSSCLGKLLTVGTGSFTFIYLALLLYFLLSKIE